MRKFALLITTFLCAVALIAGTKDSVVTFVLPDSVKAVNFISTVRISPGSGKKFITGIRNSEVSLFCESGKKGQSVVFTVPKGSEVVASGLDVKYRNGRVEWRYPWDSGEDYKLYISSASDSAANIILYSGYIFLPRESKWKLIGTCRIRGKWGTMQSPQIFNAPGIADFQNSFSNSWVQRDNGKWYNLKGNDAVEPKVMPFPSMDSIRQSALDQQLIAKAMTEAPLAKDGIYYWILREGTGPVISVTDSVTAFYKGYIFGSNLVFDQTDKEPRTFPLGRLIKGWQTGLSGTKTGGKVKLLLPSGQAYGIRTRSAKIPPNSILVFEIETTDAKTQR